MARKREASSSPGRCAPGTKSRVEILHATPSGDAVRLRDGLALDKAEWTRAEREIAVNQFDLTLSNLWHSHGDSSELEPSDTDLRTWLAVHDWANANGRSTAVSAALIYAASSFHGDTYARPHLRGWVIRREGRGNWTYGVVEPANVRQR
jgi:hypothetical protein